MKCVQLDKTIRRVSDSEASAMVKRGWTYCSKKEWREANPKRHGAAQAVQAAAYSAKR
jgi:hypothetical protein